MLQGVLDVLMGYWTLGLNAASITLGVALVCKGLNWAPVGITITLVDQTKREVS